jgi:5-methyltetrahydrofolate--homocysteine methyltransferase
MVERYRQRLSEAIVSGDDQVAAAVTREALSEGADPLRVIQEIIVPTLTEVGDRFQEMEIFLPELMMAGEAAAASTSLLEAAIAQVGGERPSLGTVVIGTVQGDIHDIGKNIVSSILSAHGFNVVDLGRDVSPEAFLEAAEKNRASIVGLSALMTTTRPAQRSTIRLLEELGVRGQYKVIVGGGSVTSDWAEEIGADGYAENAAEAADLCKSLVSNV